MRCFEGSHMLVQATEGCRSSSCGSLGLHKLPSAPRPRCDTSKVFYQSLIHLCRQRLERPYSLQPNSRTKSTLWCLTFQWHYSGFTVRLVDVSLLILIVLERGNTSDQVEATRRHAFVALTPFAHAVRKLHRISVVSRVL